jgi:hypothetical protein
LLFFRISKLKLVLNLYFKLRAVLHIASKITYLTICILAFSYISINVKGQSTISQAQAIFVYNFTKMVEWPLEYQKNDFIIGVCGNSEILAELKNYTKDKKVGNQSIKVVNYLNAENVGKCHILFVSFGKTRDMNIINERIGTNKTLIVSEKLGALNSGSAINFVVVEDKLKFELKVANANKYGLKLLSALQSMAIQKY